MNMSQKDRKERSEKTWFSALLVSLALNLADCTQNIDETTTKIVQRKRLWKEKRSASSSRWLNEHFKDPFVPEST